MQTQEMIRIVSKVDGRLDLVPGDVVVADGHAVRVTSLQFDGSRRRQVAAAEMIDQTSDDARFALLSAEIAPLKLERDRLIAGWTHGDDPRRTDPTPRVREIESRLAKLDAERETVASIEEQIALFAGIELHNGATPVALSAAQVQELIDFVAATDSAKLPSWRLRMSDGRWGRITAIDGNVATVIRRRQNI